MANSSEIIRLAGVVTALRDKVTGGGTRQQQQGWLQQQQDALKQIRALSAQDKAARANNLPTLQRQRNSSAGKLNQAVQQRLSTGRRFGAAARMARKDLQGLYQVHTMAFGQDLSFLRSRKRQPEEQVRTQQDTAMHRGQAQRKALQRNHEMFQVAREMVEPAGVEELMLRAEDAQVDVDAIDHAAATMRDMLVPERPAAMEQPVVEQPRGPQALPSPSEVRQSVMDWYDRETRSNARMRSMVSANLDLTPYQALMSPEIPLRGRQQVEADIRAQQDVDQRPPMTTPEREPPEGAHDYEAMMRPEPGPEAMAYAQQIQTEATAALETIEADQDVDYEQLDELDREIERVSGFRNAADAANHPQYDSLLQTLAVDRMTVGRRISARNRLQNTYEAERAREEVILRPDVIGDGSELWDAEGELEFMFSGLPMQRPPQAQQTEEQVRGQQDVGLPGLPGAPGYTPPIPDQYTVQQDDTLSDIAAARGVTVDELAAANDIEDPDLIHPGQVLRMPGDDEDAGTGAIEQFPADAQTTAAPEWGIGTDAWGESEIGKALRREVEAGEGGPPRLQDDQRLPQVYRDIPNLPTTALSEMPWPQVDAESAKASAFTITLREEGAISGFDDNGAPLFNIAPADATWGGFMKDEEGRVLVKSYEDNGWSVGHGMHFRKKDAADSYAEQLNERIRGGEDIMQVLVDNPFLDRHWKPVQNALDGDLLKNRRQVAGAIAMVWQSGVAGAFTYVSEYFQGERTMWSAIRNALRTKTTIGGAYDTLALLHRRARELSLIFDMPPEEIEAGMKISEWEGKSYLEAKPLADQAQEEIESGPPSEADATLALVAPAVGGGHRVSTPREARMNDALIEANKEALHKAQEIFMALGIKDEFEAEKTDRQLRGNSVWTAWRAASLGRQSGMMDTEEGQKMIRAAEAAAWNSWNQAMQMVDLRQAGWPERYDI